MAFRCNIHTEHPKHEILQIINMPEHIIVVFSTRKPLEAYLGLLKGAQNKERGYKGIFYILFQINIIKSRRKKMEIDY